MRNGNRKRNARKGFTLVEVIVVLVILALLASIIIPAMTGWIDKAKEKRLVVACRTCVLAAQTLAVEEYALTGPVTTVDTGEVKRLAGVPGDASDIALEANTATVNTLTYQEDADAVTYERMPTPHFTFRTGGGNAPTYSTISQPNVKGILGAITGDATATTKSVNSGAAADPNSNTAKALAILQAAGLDPASLGATLWYYYAGNNQGNMKMFYWTDYDISTLKAGDVIPVMRYNENDPADPADDTYTVWQAKVQTATSGTGANRKEFLRIDPNVSNDPTHNLLSEDDKTKQTYDDMLADYKKAKDSGTYPIAGG